LEGKGEEKKKWGEVSPHYVNTYAGRRRKGGCLKCGTDYFKQEGDLVVDESWGCIDRRISKESEGGGKELDHPSIALPKRPVRVMKNGSNHLQKKRKKKKNTLG